MLSKDARGTRLAFARKRGDDIYVVDDDEDGPPSITTKDPLALLTDQHWQCAFKRFRPRKKDIAKMKRSWSLNQNSIELDDQRSEMCYRFLEDCIIQRLKYEHKQGAGVRQLPWVQPFEHNCSPNHMMLAGGTGSGKGHLLNEILTSKIDGKNAFHGRDMCMFVMDPQDQSLEETRRMFKKNGKLTIVDVVKLRAAGPGAIKLEDLPAGCVLVVDDVLSALAKGDPAYRAVHDLVTEAIVRGRHHKGKRGYCKQGVTVLLAVHNGSDRGLTQIRNGMRWWVIFPKTNRAQCIKMMKQRMDLNRKAVEDILHKARASRWLAIHLVHPQAVVWDSGTMMLNH